MRPPTIIALTRKQRSRNAFHLLAENLCVGGTENYCRQMALMRHYRTECGCIFCAR
ncbi:MAG: hypothetical protein ACLUD0_12705 [Eubacterium ramulus]